MACSNKPGSHFWSWRAALCRLLGKGEVKWSCCLAEAAAAPVSLQPLRGVRVSQLHRACACLKEVGSPWLNNQLFGLSMKQGFLAGSWGAVAVVTWQQPGTLPRGILGEASCYQGWEPSPSSGILLVFWRSSLMSTHPEWMDIYSLKVVWWTSSLKTPLPYVVCCNVQTEAWANLLIMEQARAPAAWPALLTKARKRDKAVSEEPT